LSRKRPPAANAASKGLSFLVIKAGPGAGRVYPLKSTVNIGRDPRGNEIVIDDPHVSRHHARVCPKNGRFSFHDLASASGSWLVNSNGSRHRIKQPVQLAHGDVVHLGSVQLVFMEAK
jgi:pSer/pThr/pTyr-binding forkhead associated (FHA) protein